MIREATLEDVDQVVRLAQRFHMTAIYGRLFRLALERLRAVVELLVTREDALLLVDERDGDLVGMIAVSITDSLFSEDRVAEEIAWFVDPAWRSTTIGPRLFLQKERWLADKGLSWATMFAPAEVEGTADLARFYTNNGYQVLETRFIKRLL